MSEGHAILTTLIETPPDASTACEGWTAHDIVAHLTAGAKEVADLVEERLHGDAERPTRGFEERETPFVALPHDELMNELVAHSTRKLAAYAALHEQEDPSIAFTGTRLRVDELETHSRSEAAIHRWDLVGDDDTSTELLSQPELTAHAVKVLNAMPVLNESARALGERVGRPARMVLRSDGFPDVVLVTSPSCGRLELVEGASHDGEATVIADPAQRLLTLWGRRSIERPLKTDGDPEVLRILGHVFWPQAKPWGHQT